MATKFVKQLGEDGKVTVRLQGNVAIVTMDCGENRINPSFVDKMHVALDEVLSNPNVKVMVTTGVGKFYSNGIDLAHRAAKDPIDSSYGKEWQIRVYRLFLRLFTFPLITVAALNGHCYAGGAILALAHDYIVMNAERGWFCLNEVHIGAVFQPFIQEILRLRFGGRLFLDNVIFGKRYTAEEAEADGIVNIVCQKQELIDTAVKLGNSKLPESGIPRENLGNMKQKVYGERLLAVFTSPGIVETALKSVL